MKKQLSLSNLDIPDMEAVLNQYELERIAGGHCGGDDDEDEQTAVVLDNGSGMMSI